MRIVLALAAMTLPLGAAVPKIDGIFPTGGQRGSECEVAVLGAFEPWPISAVCDEERIVFSSDAKEKGKFHVVIGDDVEPGPYLIRFFNAEGANEPRIFVIGTTAERTQSGTEVLEIPVADFPLIVNGKLEASGEVARVGIELQAGQILVADVASYALDAPLDPLLNFRGPQGEQLAFNHDETRVGLDPRLIFRAPVAGRYELQLSAFAHPPQANIQFTGGATAIYRLKLGHEAPNLDLPPPHEVEGEEPQEVEVPAIISGRIDPPGESDRFRFEARKGEIFRLEVLSEAVGSWMDPLLVIEDAEGKELKRQDDIDSKSALDVKLDWTAPADGQFIAKVLDLNGVGGGEIAYRFRLSKPEPGFTATATGGAHAVRPGEKLEIAVKVERHFGHAGDLEVGAGDLPPGITSTPVAVPEKGELKLVLEATPEAPPANVPIQLWVAPKDAASDRRQPCRFEVKGATTDPGDLLVNESDRAWLTVLGKQ